MEYCIALLHLQITSKLTATPLPGVVSQRFTILDSAFSSGLYTNYVPVGIGSQKEFRLLHTESKMGLGPPSKLQVTFKLSPSMPTRLEGIITAIQVTMHFGSQTL